MTNISDIKDREPNQETIRLIEKLLGEAKRGELRSIAYVCGFDDDSWSNGWSIDNRSSRRRLIAESTLMNFDLLANQSVLDGDTVLSRIDEK